MSGQSGNTYATSESSGTPAALLSATTRQTISARCYERILMFSGKPVSCKRPKTWYTAPGPLYRIESTRRHPPANRNCSNRRPCLACTLSWVPKNSWPSQVCRHICELIVTRKPRDTERLLRNSCGVHEENPDELSRLLSVIVPIFMLTKPQQIRRLEEGIIACTMLCAR